MKLVIQSLTLIALVIGAVSAAGCAPRPDGTSDNRDSGGY